MTTLIALAEYMRLGQLPKWSPALAMRLGDELAELLRAGEPPAIERTPGDLLPPDETGDAAIRRVLVDFGALDPTDDITPPVALLECLLPRGGDGR